MDTPSSFPVFTNTTCNDASKLNNAFNQAFSQIVPSSGTNGYLQKLSGSLLVDSKFYETSTSIGIGTTVPEQYFQLRRSGGAGSLGITIDNYLGATNRDVKFFVVPDSSGDVGGFGFLTHNGASGNVAALSILSNGNVGIGTINPNSELQVTGIVNIGDQSLNAYSTFQVMKSNSNAIYILLGNVATGGYNWVYGSTAQGNGAVGGGKFVFYVLNSEVLGEKLIYYIDGDTGLVKYLYGMEVTGDLKVTSKFGCNGATPQAAYALGDACTDLATVIALANLMRTLLINDGLGKVS